MVIAEFAYRHAFSAFRTGNRIIAKGAEDRFAPSVEGKKDPVFFFGNGMGKSFVNRAVTGI